MRGSKFPDSQKNHEKKNTGNADESPVHPVTAQKGALRETYSGCRISCRFLRKPVVPASCHRHSAPSISD